MLNSHKSDTKVARKIQKWSENSSYKNYLNAELAQKWYKSGLSTVQNSKVIQKFKCSENSRWANYEENASGLKVQNPKEAWV